MTFLSVAFFITTNNSSAGHPGFRIGPDGNAYKLIDCSIPANNKDLSKCANSGPPNTVLGAISWNTSRAKAQNMTFKGFPCDLASPSTEEINDFLKSFPGFLEACNGNTTICSSFDIQFCAWFGARDPTLTEPPGPFLFVNDLNNDIPCPFAVDCDPVVMPGVGTDLTFQDWCRVATGCGGDEPNGPAQANGQFFLGYLRWPNLTGGPVGWADCKDFSCVISKCQPNSYFVQCDLPPPAPIPTLSEWGLIAMAGVLGIVEFMVIRRRKVTA